MDEICPEILKALDIVGLPQLTCPLQCHMKVKDITCGVADHGYVSKRKRLCSNYHSAQSHWESLFQRAEKGGSEQLLNLRLGGTIQILSSL